MGSNHFWSFFILFFVLFFYLKQTYNCRKFLVKWWQYYFSLILLVHCKVSKSDYTYSLNYNKFFEGFLPYFIKSSQIKKIGALYTTTGMVLFWLSYTTFFWFDLFLEARAKDFWSIWRHQKGISNVTDLQNEYSYWPQASVMPPKK